MKETFGEFIRKQREKRQLLVRKVASELDIDQSSLSKFERGDRIPPRELVGKFAKLFEVDEEELLIIYLSDKIMHLLMEEKNHERILDAARQKIKHQQFRQFQQGTLNFD